MILNTFLFFGFALLITFLLGNVIEKIRVPWIFAALLLGSALAVYNPFKEITSTDSFSFFADLGMYFLLFMIGLELDLKQLRKTGKFIIKSTFFVILLEALCGMILIHFVFGYEWFLSAIVALSFATVGEVILIPILDEFGIINTKLGQSIIGIGTLDDIFELITLILVVFMIGNGNTELNIMYVFGGLATLFLLTWGLSTLKKHGEKFNHYKLEVLFLFILVIFFTFLGIGNIAHSEPIAALMAGVAIKIFVPKSRLESCESEIRTMCYGLFAPFFFLKVGMELDIHYLINYPLLILLVAFVSNSSKIIGSYIVGHKELGTKKSILLGIGLSVRFSTSIIIVNILHTNGTIKSDIFSIIVASSIIFNFIIPFLFSHLIQHWKIKPQKLIRSRVR